MFGFNNLYFNVMKTHAIGRNRQEKCPKLNGTTNVSGITFDQCLNWKGHYHHLIKKSSSSMFLVEI